LEKLGAAVSKTTVQHYVRVGALPPPSENRYYLKEHVAWLLIIEGVKDALPLQGIRRLLTAVQNARLDIPALCDAYLEMEEQALSMACSPAAAAAAAASQFECGCAPENALTVLKTLSLAVYGAKTSQMAKESVQELERGCQC
jgi:DNA-binding transcriptional MerR regulator